MLALLIVRQAISCALPSSSLKPFVSGVGEPERSWFTMYDPSEKWNCQEAKILTIFQGLRQYCEYIDNLP